MPTFDCKYKIEPWIKSKVVTKDNASIILETTGAIRSAASMYDGSNSTTAKYLRELATKLEYIAKLMLEDC